MRILGRSQGPSSSRAPGLQRPLRPSPSQDLLMPDARSPEPLPLLKRGNTLAPRPCFPTSHVQFRQEDPTIPTPLPSPYCRGPCRGWGLWGRMGECEHKPAASQVSQDSLTGRQCCSDWTNQAHILGYPSLWMSLNSLITKFIWELLWFGRFHISS